MKDCIVVLISPPPPPLPPSLPLLFVQCTKTKQLPWPTTTTLLHCYWRLHCSSDLVPLRLHLLLPLLLFILLFLLSSSLFIGKKKIAFGTSTNVLHCCGRLHGSCDLSSSNSSSTTTSLSFSFSTSSPPLIILLLIHWKETFVSAHEYNSAALLWKTVLQLWFPPPHLPSSLLLLLLWRMTSKVSCSGQTHSSCFFLSLLLLLFLLLVH